MDFINLTEDNLSKEHLCCAIADKKHQVGVEEKKNWLKQRMAEGHVFRKLDVKGKVFIEYAPVETAWVPVIGNDYMYIYCLWVSGSFKGKGYGKMLLDYCINDAMEKGKAGVCIISSKKKTPFLSDKKFMVKQGFQVVDRIGEEYELLALTFQGKDDDANNDSKPHFTETAKGQIIENNDLTIYYGKQCPYISNCIEQVLTYCNKNEIPLNLVAVDNMEQAKAVPCVFNNWAVFNKRKFETVHLLNEGHLVKLLG